MAIFDNPFSLELSVRIGYLDITAFINENLYVTSNECRSVPHNHHDYEIRYIASGTCNQMIEGSTITASCRDLILIHPMEFHCQYHTDGESPSAQYNLRFSIRQKQCNPALAKRIRDLLNATRLLHDDSGTILFYMNRMRDEIYSKRYGYISSIQSFCQLILTELFRLMGPATDFLFPSEEMRFNGYERTRIDELFRRKYLSDVTIDDFAKDMKLSKSQINRIMNRMFGMSFTQKLTEMRLQQAVFLLTNTDLPPTQICFDCGFRSYPNFYTRFTEKYRLSPTAYRKAHAEQHEHSEK
ncbi:MAG TPA: hypothetical protein DDW30_08315 [Clostridiales bacterium]|nr:hypothetical protein [Clostridiales bacterium]